MSHSNSIQVSPWSEWSPQGRIVKINRVKKDHWNEDLKRDNDGIKRRKKTEDDQSIRGIWTINRKEEPEGKKQRHACGDLRAQTKR